MLKGTLLYLANRRPVHRLVMRHDLLRGLTQRYVAGEELADGIVVAQTLNTQRLLVSLDHLGESVTNGPEARRAVGAYVDALEAIAHDEVEANISLKLTQLGLDLSREMCVAHLRKILERSHELNTFVRIDMESSAYTQRTLEVHQELWNDGFHNVGVVLQAYLYRTAADVDRAIEVDANYARLMERLLVHGNHPAIATHDERLINRVKEIAKRDNIAPDRFDFEMLFGVRRDLQLRLVNEGYQVRVYLPYGQEWYSYLVRRLAERPANLGFFVRSLVSEALAGRRNGHP